MLHAAVEVFRFPTTGWIYDSPPFPLVSSTTLSGHLTESGKAASVGSGAVEADIVILRTPLDRAEALFFGRYVHSIGVSWSASDCYVLAKCWATQKKSCACKQHVIPDYQAHAASVSTTVLHARFECVAGECAGLCSHVLALLLALQKYRNAEASRILLRRLQILMWAIRIGLGV